MNQSTKNPYLLPFILVTSLFLLWGFAHGLLDVLNKHFQDALGVSKGESGLVQFAAYGAYFCIAFPAGMFMRKFGYKGGIIAGLALAATGAFIFIPITSFYGFLGALFILMSGLTFLETCANPYISVLGPEEQSESRINLAQSFNGLGWILGPFIGGQIIFGMDQSQGSTLHIPYLILGVALVLVALLFFVVKLPEIEAGSVEEGHGVVVEDASKEVNLSEQKHFWLAVLAQFLYVAAQTGVFSFFINYVTEEVALDEKEASSLLAFGGFGLFFIGRLSGSYIMKILKGNKLLAIYAAACMVLMFVVYLGLGWMSVIALFSSFFFMSIMYPTIFALGIKGLGNQTKKASSFLVMAILGGALAPMSMGFLADKTSMQVGFLVPLVCFIYLVYFGLKGYKPTKG